MITVSRILHAGYLFECEGVSILFDPIFENPFSRNCHAFPDVRFDLDQVRGLRLDAVFISHYHDDHCSFDSLDLLPRDTPIYMYCLFDEMFDMLRALGFHKVVQLRTNEPVAIGPFEITPREALDADVDSLFQIRAAGLNVLNVVDAWIGDDTMERLVAEGPWDMVLWPFQTMREVAVLSPRRAAPHEGLPDEFIDQLRALAPRYVVPSSCQFVQEPWSWYNHAMFPITYAHFEAVVEAALPATRVVRMNPSVSFTLDAQTLTPCAPLPWVIPVGEQSLDFDYRPDLAPPHTAGIARHFAPLAEEERRRIVDYCTRGLLEKYRTMPAEDDGYFAEPRVWQLSLYEHDGSALHFRYRVHGNRINAADASAEPLGWLTELPALKLFAALERGESLTSMYVRVNDTEFSPAQERDLKDADVIDDPLIRSLFNDVFGAYQAAQLARLLLGDRAA
jgi:hypothetical protein